MMTCRSSRGADRRREIQEHACRLVVERGYDGFTMDDLAAAVGVSRRTLFNHVPDKAAAVLGDGGEPDAQGPHLDAFLAGGPTGVLALDAVALVRAVLTGAETHDPDLAGRVHLAERAVAADPKVAALAVRRFEEGTSRLVDLVCRREGWVAGDLRAQVLTMRVVGLMKVMLAEVRRRRGVASFVDALDEVLAAEAELLADVPAPHPAA